jgi:hypothetical protein
VEPTKPFLGSTSQAVSSYKLIVKSCRYRECNPQLEYTKSSQVNTLPKAKSKTRSKQNKDMRKCSSVYSERGVPLPVLTSGGEWVGVRACKSLCDVTQTSDPANSPPCASRTRLRDVCSTRPLRKVGPEPLHPHVCGPHVALEVGDHLMLFTIRRRSQVSLFLARVGRTCTLDRKYQDIAAQSVLSDDTPVFQTAPNSS